MHGKSIKMRTEIVVEVFKYFLHGLGFSILYGILFFLFMGSFIGAFLGLISVLALILFLGYANSFLTAVLWTKMEPDWDAWGKLTLQGFVLLIAWLIVNLILEIPSMVVSSIATYWIVFIGRLFANGYVAKNIGVRLCEYKE